MKKTLLWELKEEVWTPSSPQLLPLGRWATYFTSQCVDLSLADNNTTPHDDCLKQIK